MAENLRGVERAGRSKPLIELLHAHDRMSPKPHTQFSFPQLDKPARTPAVKVFLGTK